VEEIMVKRKRNKSKYERMEEQLEKDPVLWAAVFHDSPFTPFWKSFKNPQPEVVRVLA
jgi:hypothetical protein